jgi:hypothetical protein
MWFPQRVAGAKRAPSDLPNRSSVCGRDKITLTYRRVGDGDVTEFTWSQIRSHLHAATRRFWTAACENVSPKALMSPDFGSLSRFCSESAARCPFWSPVAESVSLFRRFKFPARGFKIPCYPIQNSLFRATGILPEKPLNSTTCRVISPKSGAQKRRNSLLIRDNREFPPKIAPLIAVSAP